MNTTHIRTELAFLNHLRGVMDVTAEGCVSVYAPGHHLGDVLNRLREAYVLRGNGASPNGTAASDAAVELLLSTVDPSAMQAETYASVQSVALLATPDRVWPLLLPTPVSMQVTVGGRFHLRPLLQMFGPAHIVGLMLSSHGATLTQTFGPSTHTTELDVDVPSPAASASSPGDGSLSSMRSFVRWISAVDHALGAFLPRRHHAVVCVGPPEMTEAYAAINLHRTLIRPSIGGQPSSPSDQIRRTIAQAAQRHQEQQATRDLHRLHETHAFAPERCAHDPHVIAREAASRRVETLFVDESLVEGAPPLPSGDGAPASTVSIQDSVSLRTHCHIERAVARTFVAGGTVHPVRSTRLPAGHRMAALLRY